MKDGLALDGNTTLDVATVPVITLLKMAAWLDRPGDRGRDLEDLAHVLNDYLPATDERRWEDDLLDSGLSHDNQSAFALGQDVARIAGPAHLTTVDSFFTQVSEEASAHHALFARAFHREHGSKRLMERLRAFLWGMGRLPRQ